MPKSDVSGVKGLSTEKQKYDVTAIINEVRSQVDSWRALPNPNQWQVTPETTRLLQHWRHHEFSGVRPFFCQIEAVETAIWLTEVAPQSRNGKRLLDHLDSTNKDANPELTWLALKLATGAGKTTVMAMRLILDTVTVDHHSVSMDGPPVVLEKLAQTGAIKALPEVLSFAQEWRAGVGKGENWTTILKRYRNPL